ncbi:hypothetical protein IWQ60_004919 [Tieghemiomyces parasiticus]|uniref:Uncharacterized protein n=1 Tax=Tieghemiomyces parasiticus TaxID=78921 RepID=A0A9W8DYX0_9FUNG|nr:hypothetical protein IWQ60_004919 [Tieghemiomyces parasiticus]
MALLVPAQTLVRLTNRFVPFGEALTSRLVPTSLVVVQDDSASQPPATRSSVGPEPLFVPGRVEAAVTVALQALQKDTEGARDLALQLYLVALESLASALTPGVPDIDARARATRALAGHHPTVGDRDPGPQATFIGPSGAAPSSPATVQGGQGGEGCDPSWGASPPLALPFASSLFPVQLLASLWTWSTALGASLVTASTNSVAAGGQSGLASFTELPYSDSEDSTTQVSTADESRLLFDSPHRPATYPSTGPHNGIEDSFAVAFVSVMQQLAVALKRSPIPHLFTALLAYFLYALQVIDHQFLLHQRMWDLAKRTCRTALVWENHYRLHQRLGQGAALLATAILRAVVAYRQTDPYPVTVDEVK